MYTHKVMMNRERLETYFKALADANRLRILNLLAVGELCGCDIQIVLELTQSNVSRHLSYLKHAGLVADRREGYRIFYSLADCARMELKPLFDFLHAIFSHDQEFQDDVRRLKLAVKEGACQMRPLVQITGQTGSRAAPGSGRRGARRSAAPAAAAVRRG